MANKKIKNEMLVKDLKSGQWFTLSPISEPKDSQVYERGGYDRSDKKYCCGRRDDISYSRNFKGNRKVYTDFYY